MKDRIRSFGHAIRGIKMVFGSEINMKIHIVIAALVVFFGFFFCITLTEWLLCLICFGLVIGAEMFNTAIEHVVDLASPEFHHLAGKAKDIAAGAVLIAAIFAALVGLIIFLPKIYLLLSLLFNF